MHTFIYINMYIFKHITYAIRDMLIWENISEARYMILREKCPNTGLFLVRVQS